MSIIASSFLPDLGALPRFQEVELGNVVDEWHFSSGHISHSALLLQQLIRDALSFFRR